MEVGSVLSADYCALVFITSAVTQGKKIEVYLKN